MNKMTLAQLRDHIAALESPGRRPAVLPFGVAEIDGFLPWGGLPLGALHEVALPTGDAPDGPTLGLVAMLLGRLARQQERPVLWVSRRLDLYAPGLAAFGLPADRLLMVQPGRAAEGLMALEDAVRCPGLAAVAGDIWELDATAGRRLHLAARDSGVTALVMTHGTGAGRAMTRWRVAAAPSVAPAHPAARLGVGAWRWSLTLVHCRNRGRDENGVAARWLVEWQDETHRLGLVAVPGDRSAVPGSRYRAAG
jgi:protein ImuA